MLPMKSLRRAVGLAVEGVLPPFEKTFGEELAQDLSMATGTSVYAPSLLVVSGTAVFLAKGEQGKRLCAVSPSASPGKLYETLEGAESRAMADEALLRLKVCPLVHANAAVLRRFLPFTAPKPVGLATSVGLGDRLGLATPGHLRAVEGTGVVPFLAQQSIREMTRTERSADEVMDCATWGVLEYGWRGGFGSDADHLKNEADIDRTAAAGFTMFTVDPGDHVDGATDSDDDAALAKKYEALPWDALECTAEECKRNFVGRPMPADCAPGPFGERELLHAAAKYGKAVAHTAAMYRHLAQTMGGRPFELETSVDETATPTTPHEHFYIAAELRRLGVQWVSLAPRFVGEFEKGVDYIGDLDVFRRDFAYHAAIARRFGPYKISLHSGSDKFSVYPVAAELAGNMVHVKTAGTSYLEAVRAIGTIDPGLFREILAFALERYEEDKATYHVSADPNKVPKPDALKDAELPGVLDLFDGRQVLHVTFGSVLTTRQGGGTRFRERILDALKRDEETHYAVLARHIGKHVAPFAKP